MSGVTSGLVDASKLARVPPAVWRALGARLRDLDLAGARQGALRIGRGVPIELRAPVRRRRLRASRDDIATLLRLLCFEDAVPADDVVRALGASITGALLDAEVLARHPKGVAAQLTLTPLDHLLLLGDPLRLGGDAVMAVGTTTIGLCRAAVPSSPVDRVLDVGCGAGAAALCLARNARVAVGVDINPRAALLARVNAAVNAVDNVELRVGDLFAPVAGERFDLIVSQPPFVARPEGAPDATYMHGGARGDELMVRMLRELPAHLAGRAFVFGEWPRTDDRPVTALARDAIGTSELSLWSFEERDASPDEIAAAYAAAEHATFDEAYATSARRRREHFARLGVGAITQALLVVTSEEALAGATTARVPLSSTRLTQLSGARIEARLAADRLLAAGTAALLRARLRISPGVTVGAVWGAPGAPPRYVLEHPTDPLVATTEVNAPTRDLVLALDREPDVRTAMALVAARHRVPREQIVATLLPIVEGALRQGLLSVS
ncbi:MAG: methyltransferase [Deltaproteobacteria bacterium]|nr:methyltransferase [Deltaproteobacteria bacterium]